MNSNLLAVGSKLRLVDGKLPVQATIGHDSGDDLVHRLGVLLIAPGDGGLLFGSCGGSLVVTANKC